MKHDIVEKNIGLMAVLIAVAISFGGLAEIVPLMMSRLQLNHWKACDPIQLHSWKAGTSTSVKAAITASHR